MLSEQFGGALVTDIMRDEARLPVGFLDQLLEYRAFAHAVAMNKADPNGWESSPMRKLAMEFEGAAAAAAFEDAQQGHG